MRSFGSSFTTEKNKEATPYPFWTAIFRFSLVTGGSPKPDMYLSDRPVTISGNVYNPLIVNWGDLGSSSLRSDEQLETPTVALEFHNGPELPGPSRFSDKFGSDFESVRVDFYLNFELTSGSIVQELLFTGVAQAPISYNYLRGFVTVTPLMDKYLNDNVLRVISDETFPDARNADIGKPIPIVIGNVPQCIGVITRFKKTQDPVSGATNGGEGVLGRVYVVNNSAPSGTWRITFEDSLNYSVYLPSGALEGEGFITDLYRSSNIRIFAEDFDGDFVAGDTITFEMVSGDSAKVVFSESPSGNSVSNISKVYYDGYELSTTDVTIEIDDSLFPFAKSTYLADDKAQDGAATYGRASGAGNLATVNVGKTAFNDRFVVVRMSMDDSQAAYVGSTQVANRATERVTSIQFSVEKVGNPTHSLNVTVSDFLTGPDYPGGTGDIGQYSLNFRYLAQLQLNPADVGTSLVAFNLQCNFPVSKGKLYYVTFWTRFLSDTNYYLLEGTSGPAAVGFRPDNASLTGWIDANPPWVVFQTAGSTTIGNEGLTQLSGEAVSESLTVVKAILVKQIELELEVENDPDGDVTVDVTRDVSGSPEGEVVATAVFPMTSVVNGVRSVISFDKPFFMRPGNYHITVTAPYAENNTPDESSIDKSSPKASKLQFLVSKTFRRTATGELVPAYPRETSSGGVVQSSWGGRKALYERTSFRDVATVGLSSSTEYEVHIDMTLIVAKITKSTGAIDEEGQRVAQISFDCELPEDADITADMVGIQRRRPDDCVRFFLNRASVSDTDIDLSGSFSRSAAQYGGTYNFDGQIIDQLSYKQLMLQFGRESRSIFDWSAHKAKFFFIPTSGNIVQTLTLDDVVLADKDGPPLVENTRTDPLDLANTVRVRWNRDFTKNRDVDSYKKVTKRTDSASIAIFQTRARDEFFLMDFVRSENMATALADFYLRKLKYTRKVVNLVTKLHNVQLEPTDIIGLNLDPSAVTTLPDSGFGEGGFGEGGFGGVSAFDGLSGSQPFLVETTKIIPTERRIELVTTELVATPPPPTVTTIPTGMSYTDSVTLGAGAFTRSWEHMTAGDNRLLLVQIGAVTTGGDVTISSITFNGTALTQQLRVSHAPGADKVINEVWSLTAPDNSLTGSPTSAYTVVVSGTVTGSAEVRTVSISFKNVDQTTPLGTLASDTGATPDSVTTAAVTSSATGFTVDFLVIDDDFYTLITQRTGQEYLYIAGSVAGQTGGPSIGVSAKTAAVGTITMGWNLTQDGGTTNADPLALIVVPIRGL